MDKTIEKKFNKWLVTKESSEDGWYDIGQSAIMDSEQELSDIKETFEEAYSIAVKELWKDISNTSYRFLRTKEYGDDLSSDIIDAFTGKIYKILKKKYMALRPILKDRVSEPS